MSTIFFNDEYQFQIPMYDDEIPLLPQEPVFLNPITDIAGLWDLEAPSKLANSEWQNTEEDGIPVLTSA